MKRGPKALASLLLVCFLGAVGHPAPSLSQAESPAGQGESQATFRSSYDSAKAALRQGDLDGAEQHFQQSFLISQKMPGGSLAVAQSLNGLGDVAQQRGRPAEAEAYYQQAFAIIQKLNPLGAEAADSLDGLARVEYDREDIAKSEEHALQALSIRQNLEPDNLDLAASFNSIANLHAYHEHWDQAEESYKKALRIQERLAPESLALAETLSNLGSVFCQRRQYDEGSANQQRALTIRTKLAPGSLVVADSLWRMGICARRQPDVRKRYYREALTIQERLAPNSVHVARTLTWLYRIELQNEPAAAEADGSRALAIWEKLAPDSALFRDLMYALADLLLWKGDLAGAEELARKALEASRKADPVSVNTVANLFTLGTVATQRGDFTTAEDYYHQALEINEKIDPGGSLSARLIRRLGIIANARGDLAKAEEYFRRTLAIWEKTDPDSNTLAQGLFTVAVVVHERGDLVQAEGYYRRAVALWEKVAPGTMFLAQGLDGLGQLARDQGDLVRAEDYERRAVAIAQNQVPGSPILADALNDLGDVRLARGELSEALECYRQALAIRKELIPGSRSHAASLAAMARIMNRQGNLDAAAEYYQQALNALEDQAARLGSGDELRAGYRAKYASYYKDYIDLLVGQKRFDLAFQVLERFRARSLLETLAVAHAEIRKSADAALLQRQRSLQQSLTAKTQRRIELLGAKNRDAELGVLAKEIQDLRAQYREVEGQILSNSPSYAALMHPQPISAKEVQEQLLDEDTVLLEYSLGQERSYVWVLTRNSLATHELPKRSNIDEAAREIYRLLTARGEIHPPESAAQRLTRLERAQQDFHEKAATLSHMLLGPVAAEIENKKRLLVVSDGALQYVPFAALPDPETGTAAMEAVPLLTKHEIVNLPSASVLAVLRQEEARRQPAPKAVAVLADPVFTSADSRVQARAVAGRGVTHARSTSDKNYDALASDSTPAVLTRSAADVGLSGSGRLNLPRLPFSRREADAILAVTQEGMGLKAVDFDASRAIATSKELAQYRIVHFATHGLVDSQHPELSGLVLSLVDKQGRSQDGFLQLQDIYNLNLAADLVVLSACETGLGKEVNGEGLIGLTRGFMYAGATRVVSSLWNVDDFATAKLMKVFYTSMERDGKRPAEALREAQLSLLKQPRWSSPYYWAGFTIQGEWK